MASNYNHYKLKMDADFLSIAYYFNIINDNFNRYQKYSLNSSFNMSFYEINNKNINKIKNLIYIFKNNTSNKQRNKYGQKISNIHHHLNYNKKLNYIEKFLEYI
tara:strand:- start:1038 stop:1349 length:312 start_codon:yes stop_codon:yes gene_type:complete